MKDKTFKEFTDKWLEIAGNFMNKDILQDRIDSKFFLSENIFEFLTPPIQRFIDTSLGRTHTNYGEELSFGYNINRLLKKKSFANLSPNVALNLEELIINQLLFGILTHLYLIDFPTRANYEEVDIIKLENEWIINAIAADNHIGYYGLKENPICMDIYHHHYKNKVRPILKKQIGINMFKIGAFDVYFKHLYLAGALLIMSCDLRTRKVN